MRMFAVLCACLLLSGSVAYAAPACPVATTQDAERAADAVRGMYAAAASRDLPAYRQVMMPDFYAFEGGKRMTADDLWKMVDTLAAAGTTFTWKVVDPEVHAVCGTAWITYVNRGTMTDASGTHDLSWVESAVAEERDGAWRLRFFHSTRVP